MSYQPNKLVDGKLVHEDDYYKSPWGFWDYLDTFLFSLYFCAVILFLGSLI